MPLTIPASDLPKVDISHGVIIDVRTGVEHNEKRLTCAHAHIPLDTLNPRAFMNQNNLNADTPVYLLCRSGGRATQAAAQFMAAGYPNVTVIEGGIMACEACGHDVVGSTIPSSGTSTITAPDLLTIRRPITLERQVRIAAGSLILIGFILSLFIHPIFIGLTIFVGAGLVYAGLTDRCGMALMLAHAPWNKQ